MDNYENNPKDTIGLIIRGMGFIKEKLMVLD